MTRAIVQKNLDIYGNDPIPWSRASEGLETATRNLEVEGHAPITYWMSTVGPDGTPHVAGVGAVWLDGAVYFTSGDGTRKSRDLAANPKCAIAVALPGLDVVLHGTAAKVGDEATLQRLARLYAAQGWPASVRDGALTAAFSAPSAGPPPWYLYVLKPRTAFGVATAEPWGAMRWRLED
ncbi:MAG: pyridoxamine 5'-phosphate oxidase family protein [Chloroflexota bacterium]|nr:pyridoxamine 5'-phosphate oxidase family protein [Chloroflexota bacterium]